MALWKEVAPRDAMLRTDLENGVTTTTVDFPRRIEHRAENLESKESLIAGDLTIEGRIEGKGHVRLAGAFKGDVRVEGNLTIEPGARLNGEVHADTVIVGGDLQGNIQAATRVELQESGMLVGDLKAVTLTVAAGSRMRGHAEFGWDERRTDTPDLGMQNGSGL